MKYIAKNLSKKQLAVVVRELRALEKRHGMITPEMVVAMAAPTRAPLHRYFQWDNSKAAAEFRLWQARNLVARVYVRVTEDPAEKPVLRAFVNVVDAVDDADDDGGPRPAARGYVGVDTARAHLPFKNQVLHYALVQLQGWKRRYGAYKEFMAVSEAIEHVKV